MVAYTPNFRPWIKKGVRNPGYVTITDAARMMCVNRRWLKNWIDRHGVPTISEGPNRKRYLPLKFIERHGKQFFTYFESIHSPY